ncbi:MAG: hypothetical protein JWP11_491 [Frankiales bacterium]|nr:hypothetical protein [Frankiales bacterium]
MTWETLPGDPVTTRSAEARRRPVLTLSRRLVLGYDVPTEIAAGLTADGRVWLELADSDRPGYGLRLTLLQSDADDLADVLQRLSHLAGNWDVR